MLVRINLLQRNTAVRENRIELILKRRLAKRRLDPLRNWSMLLEHLHEMRITQPGHRFNRAELHTLRSARSAEISAKLREVLGRQRFERIELRGYDSHQRIH